MQTTSEDELRSVVESNFDLLSDSGFTRPSVLVKESNKVNIVQALALHDVLLRSKAEFDQFCEGQESCGVLGAIRQNSDLARKYTFVSMAVKS